MSTRKVCANARGARLIAVLERKVDLQDFIEGVRPKLSDPNLLAIHDCLRQK